MGVYGCSKKREVPSGMHPGELYISKILACLDHAGMQFDRMKEAADEAAGRAVSGGTIYVTDDETLAHAGEMGPAITEGGTYYLPINNEWGGFATEAYGRAGGLTKIFQLPAKVKLSDRDIVLVGTLELNPDAQYELLNALKNMGALLIVFGSRNSRAAGLADYLIDNGLGPGTVPVVRTASGKMTGPVAGIANIIHMWVFTAEYAAALTRSGKMPSMWQSMFVPGAARRNKRVNEFTFHPDITISPVPPGILGKQYIDSVKSFLEGIKTDEMDAFFEAGKLCAETITSGKKVTASLIGHFMASQQRMPEYPNIFTVNDNEFGSGHLKGVLSQGDIWLHVGYSYYPLQELQSAREAGAQTICVFTPGPSVIGEGPPVTPDKTLIDVYIDPYWKHGDAVVEIPGYDIKVIPPSGVVMTTCYWMILVETVYNLPPGRLEFPVK